VARIDQYLIQMAQQEASALLLNANTKPVFELPAGHRAQLASGDLEGLVLDGIVKEILPDDLKTTYLRGDTVTFSYALGDDAFVVRASRANGNPRVVAIRKPGLGALPRTEAPARPAAETAGTPPTGFALAAPPAPPAPAPAASSAIPSLASPVLPTIKPVRRSTLPLEDYFGKVIDLGGSDLYLNPGEIPLVRHHGEIEVLDGAEAVVGGELELALKALLPPKNWTLLQEQGATSVSHPVPARDCNLRLDVLRDGKDLSVSVRVMPKNIPPPDVLGFSEAVRRLWDVKRGLVILTGSLGSGRTTSLAALISLAAGARPGFLVTVEDSISFKIPSKKAVVRQRAVGGDPASQRKAIQAALRQGPDILGVDEVQDAGTFLMLLEAAHAGSLVIATMPGASAISVLQHAIDLYPHERQETVRAMLGSSLKAVVGHSLMKRKDGGQLVVFESLFNTPAIGKLIRQGDWNAIPASMKTGRAYGQVQLTDALLTHIQEGRLEPMEAYLRTPDREAFMAACKKAKIPFEPRKGSGGMVEA
jgi:twitching motility protein PilT